MNKKHLIGYPAAVILAMTIGAAGASGSSNATAPVSTVTVAGPAPAPVTKTVTQAPAECGTALDLMSEFATAVATEHKTMGDAFTKAGQDGDLLTAMSKTADAAKALTAKMTDLTPQASAAAQVCRAAIK